MGGPKPGELRLKCTSVDEYEAFLNEGIECIKMSPNPVMRQIHAARVIENYFDNSEEMFGFLMHNENECSEGAEFISFFIGEKDVSVLTILYNKLLNKNQNV